MLNLLRDWISQLLAGQQAVRREVRQVRRTQRHIIERLDRLMTQVEEVRAELQTLAQSNESLRTSLSGVAADVTGLKEQIANLPVGEPIDAETMAELRRQVASVAEVTDLFAELDQQTPGSSPE